jgi:AraC-like DNA-binding protein
MTLAVDPCHGREVLFVPGYSSLILGLLNALSGIVNLAFAVLILLKGLKQSDLFTGISGQKYVTARLARQEIEAHRKKLEAVMADRKPHLDPELTLDNLAKMLSIPARHLSQVINTGLYQNFFDFVSEHRILEAKQMLSDPRNTDKTILNILYDASFNSKSSFNDLIRKKRE